MILRTLLFLLVTLLAVRFMRRRRDAGVSREWLAEHQLSSTKSGIEQSRSTWPWPSENR